MLAAFRPLLFVLWFLYPFNETITERAYLFAIVLSRLTNDVIRFHFFPTSFTDHLHLKKTKDPILEYSDKVIVYAVQAIEINRVF